MPRSQRCTHICSPVHIHTCADTHVQAQTPMHPPRQTLVHVCTRVHTSAHLQILYTVHVHILMYCSHSRTHTWRAPAMPLTMPFSSSHSKCRAVTSQEGPVSCFSVAAATCRGSPFLLSSLSSWFHAQGRMQRGQAGESAGGLQGPGGTRLSQPIPSFSRPHGRLNPSPSGLAWKEARARDGEPGPRGKGATRASRLTECH